MNEDMLLNKLLEELLGSNEDCLRKASEQIVTHVLKSIYNNITEYNGHKMSDTEINELVEKYLTNENNSSVPLPISEEVVRSTWCRNIDSFVFYFIMLLILNLICRIHQ